MKKMINSGTYKVDKNIELVRKRSGSTRFPFDKMRIGDSFLIPLSDQSIDTARLSVYSAARSYVYHNGDRIKISCRAIKGEGFRVWRIA